MKKILFTTAYSEGSKYIWEYTLRLAKYFNAQITVMHVAEMVKELHYASDQSMMDEEWRNFPELDQEGNVENEKLKLRDFITKNTHERFNLIPFHFVVSSGSVSEAILEEEATGEYDLVVIGTSQGNSLGERVFGRTSEKVVDGSNTPVFLVPPKAKYISIEKIVYATNFEFHDLKCINEMFHWMEAFYAKLHLLHVYKEDTDAKKAMDKMLTLMRTFQEPNEAGVMTFQVMKGDVVKNIEDYLLLSGADLIALCNNKKGVLSRLLDESITHQLSAESMVPILVFKNN